MFLPLPATSRVIPSAVWNLTLWETNKGVTSLPDEGPEPRSIGTRLCHLTPSTHCYHPALPNMPPPHQLHLDQPAFFSLLEWHQPVPLIDPATSLLKKWTQVQKNYFESNFRREMVITHWPQYKSNQSRSHFPKSAFSCGHDYCQTNIKYSIFQSHPTMRFTTEQALSWNGGNQYFFIIPSLTLSC